MKLLKLLTQQIWFPWIVGLIVIVPAILPFFQSTLFKTHDFTHVTRLVELDKTVREGGIPPRWSKNLGFGYGMPLFSFYAPLPYYLGVGFHALGLSYINAVKLLFILSFYFSFMAMYYFARQFWRPIAAYVSAFLFMYAPYRAVDVYARGALGELYGLLALMVLLSAISHYCLSKKKIELLFVAISTAALLLSHNLMAFVGIPFAVLFGVFLLLVNRPLKIVEIVRLAIGFIWGLGISAYFIVPAILEKQYTSVDQLTTGEGTYSQHFVYLKQFLFSPWGYGGSISGPNDGMTFQVGKVTFLVLFGALIMLVVRKNQPKKCSRAIGWFALSTFCLSLFLMTFHSHWLWRVIPGLSYLQFPWRFLTIAMIASSWLGGFVVDCLKRFRTSVTWIVAVILVGLALITTLPMFVSDPSLNPSENIYPTNELYIKTEMSKVIPDYIHPQLAHLVLSKEKDIIPSDGRFSVFSDGLFQLVVLSDKSQSFKVQIKTDQPLIFRVNIFDFPGWELMVNGEKVTHTVNNQLPTMSIPIVPVGTNTFIIEGILKETPLRFACDWVSVLSLVLVGLVSGCVIVRRKKDYANNR